MKNLLKAVAQDETGSELVEVGMSVWLWVLCVMGIVYVSFGVYAAHFVSSAAEDAARYAMVRGSTWSGTSCNTTSTFECAAKSSDVSNYVTSQLLPGLSSQNLSVTSTWPGTTANGNTCDTSSGSNSPYCVVNVTVTYNLRLTLPLIPISTIPLSSTSKMTIVS